MGKIKEHVVETASYDIKSASLFLMQETFVRDLNNVSSIAQGSQAAADRINMHREYSMLFKDIPRAKRKLVEENLAKIVLDVSPN